MIKNIIIGNEENGYFDLKDEGYDVEIIEVYEDAVEYVCPTSGEVVISVIEKIEGETAYLRG